MPTVSQIRMQAAANSVNNATAKPGSVPGGSATPGGFDAFLAALNQTKATKQNASADFDRFGNQNTLPAAVSRQNLPADSQESLDTAKNSDPMQMLMAQLVAQGMMVQNGLTNSNNGPQTLPVANQSGVSAIGSQSMNIQALLASLNAQSGNSAQDLAALISQQPLDTKQIALISQALTKAMKASGQTPDALMQTQVSSLLQALQGRGAQNTQDQALNQNLSQTPAQIASAIQDFAQKNGIQLPPEIQTQLTNLINQGGDQSAGIKLIGVQGDATMQAGNVDPTKANTIQNLTEGKPLTVMTSAGDKLPKGKILDNPLAINALGDKNQGIKPGSLVDDALKAFASSQGETSNSEQTDHLSTQKTQDRLDLNPLATVNTGLTKVDNHADVAAQKLEIKASEVSLTTGPLHSEVMSAAKSGGGRIMLELTPPEQGTIRIDLRINSAGQAHLIVEGASDATKSRLDQGGQNLKNEFAQMGLNLSLDLKQGNQSQQMRDQASFGGSQAGYGNISSNTQTLRSSTSVNIIGSGDNRGSSSTVNLYA